MVLLVLPCSVVTSREHTQHMSQYIHTYIHTNNKHSAYTHTDIHLLISDIGVHLLRQFTANLFNLVKEQDNDEGCYLPPNQLSEVVPYFQMALTVQSVML